MDRSEEYKCEHRVAGRFVFRIEGKPCVANRRDVTIRSAKAVSRGVIDPTVSVPQRDSLKRL